MPVRYKKYDWQSYGLGTLTTGDGISQDGTHNLPQIVSSATDLGLGPMTGTKMLRTNDDGTVADTDPAWYETCKIAIPTGVSFLSRVWFRRDTNFTKTSGSSKKILRFFQAEPIEDYNDMFGGIFVDAGLTNFCVVSQSQRDNYWGDSLRVPGSIPIGTTDASLSTSAWHKIEYYISTVADGGVTRVWHDDLLVRDESGLATFDNEWGPLYITSNFEDAHDATNHLYWGDIEIFTETGTGDACTGSLADASVEAVTGSPDGGSGIVIPKFVMANRRRAA